MRARDPEAGIDSKGFVAAVTRARAHCLRDVSGLAVGRAGGPADADLVADVLNRLAVSFALAPTPDVRLDDPEQRDAYARSVVDRLFAA